MGKLSTTGTELSPAVITGALTSTTADGNTFSIVGDFNVFVWGSFVGTAQVQQSFDGGSTWFPELNRYYNANVQFTAPGGQVVSEPEPGILYRIVMTSYTSGTCNYRVSGGQRLT